MNHGENARSSSCFVLYMHPSATTNKNGKSQKFYNLALASESRSKHGERKVQVVLYYKFIPRLQQARTESKFHFVSSKLRNEIYNHPRHVGRASRKCPVDIFSEGARLPRWQVRALTKRNKKPERMLGLITLAH